MKDKIKSEKASGPTTENKPDGVDDMKKEPGLCETDPAGKNGDANLNVNKAGERSFLDLKTELGPRPEDLKQEDELLGTKIKSESMGVDGTGMFPTDGNENLMLGVGPGPEGPPTTPMGPANGPPGSGPGVQPLPSNVINKQPGTMEAQYMQQQSQIFVFSTSLANKAAETVIQGQFQSIIAYHCAQPGTKKYLEKHPLKLNQFNRQSPAQWLNNLAQFKQKGFGGPVGSPGGPPQGPPHMGPKGRGIPEMGHGPGGPPGPRMMGPGGPMHDMDGMPDGPDMGPNREMHPNFPGMNVWNQQGGMNHGGNMNCGPNRDKACLSGRPPPMGMDPFPGMSQYTLTGTKVPTENLTPQQRQHREEQLATIRKMHQLFFPENQSQPTDEFGNPRMMMPQHPQDGGPPNGNANGPHPPGPMGSPMMNPNAGMVGSPLNPPNNMGMGCGDGPDQMNQDPSLMQKMGTGPNAQMDWQKLQQQFYDDRKKKGPRTESPVPRGRNGGPNNCGMKMPMNMGGMPPMGPMQGGGMPPMMSQGGPPGPPNMGGQPPPNMGGPPMQGNMMGQMAGGGMPPMQGVPGMQGPPPPYHQTARSASVPVPVPSPAPESPSNTSSNLSLPSPRTASDLNSSTEVGKMTKMTTCSPPTNQSSPNCSKLPPSNPDTPVSASQSPTSNKEMYNRSQKVGKPSGVGAGSKEPNLMPVPSPQQIQYLNAFEGQELTIQKQPNTSLKDGSSTSPLNHQQQISDTPQCKTPTTSSPGQQQGSPRFQQQQQQGPGSQGPPQQSQSQPQTPQQQQQPPTPAGQQGQGPLTPHSGGPPNKGEFVMKLRFQQQQQGPGSQGPPQQSQSQPQTPQQQQPPRPAGQQGQGPLTPHSGGPPNKDGNPVPSSPDHGGQTGRSPCRPPPDNVPLNPNGVNCPPANKSLHFDPITSLAQMSQQLTSQAPPCQGPPFSSNPMMTMDQAMHMESMESLPFVPQQGPPMMDMPPGYMNNPSPKPGMPHAPHTPPVRCGPPFFGGPQFPRMMGPGPPYNGMNVQVKASTPNTIQYLPARPSGGSPIPGVRNPPSLDFLQRFANPGPDGKPPMFMGNCHPGQEPPNMMMGGNMLRGQMRPGMKPGPPNMGKPGPPGFDPMNPMNPQGMFKGGPMGMPPEASQPLPPSMSQSNNFKNSPFVGPTITDPNYAQQFHNFQQQLYATNTRSQLNSHLNQSYFMPK